MRYVEYPNVFKEWINKPVRQLDFKMEFNGQTLTTSDIISIKLNADLLPSDSFTLGSSVSETLEFEMFMDSDTFIDTTKPIKPYVSLYTEVEINGTLTPVWQDVCLGIYYANPGGITKDGLNKVSVKASSLLSHSEYGGRTYVAPDPFDGKVSSILSSICKELGISLYGSALNATIKNRDNVNGMTYRELIEYVALMYGGYARITGDNKLQFFRQDKTAAHKYDTDSYITLTKDDEVFNLKKIICATSEKGSISKGDGLISESVELACPDMTDALITDMANYYLGFSYSPIVCKIFGDPRLEVGDLIQVVDVKGNTHILPLHSITYNVTGSGITMDVKSLYKANSIAKGTSIRKAVNELNQDIVNTKILVANEIEAINGRFDKLDADIANIGDLTAVNASIKKLQAEKADITYLESDFVKAEKLNADYITANQIEATYVKTSKLESDYATIKNLKATEADIDDLEAKVGKIGLLIGNNASIDNIESIILTSKNTTIENALIKDAMIYNISADKIDVGTINTNNVSIQSEDGGISIADETMQFKDEDGNVRIQIGRDTNNDFTFALYGANGEGQLINQDGIQKSSAIADGLIRNDHVADNAAISGGKIDMKSLYETMNADGSNTLKASKIYYSDTDQTLDVAFNKMTTKVDGNTSSLNTQSTQITTMQGQIGTLITDTTITDENGTSKIKDRYIVTEQTVKGLTSKVSDLETTYETTLQSSKTMYYLSNSRTELTGGEWKESVTQQAGKYIWLKIVYYYNDGSSSEGTPVCIQGADGNAAEGVVLYTWIRYADDANGTNISNDPTGKAYIGFAYNQTTAAESNKASDYTWSKIVGEKGDTGEQGPQGASGTTYYTWIKYSDNSNGNPCYDTPKDTTQYIGIAINKTTASESSDYTQYTWSKFKGDQGIQGPQGNPGTTTYTWIKYADNASGSGLSDSPTGKTYIGFAYNKTTATESNTASDYTWSKIVGDKGDTGEQGPKGDDGTTTYTWIKYSDNANGSGLYDTPKDTTQYIGIAVNKTTATESTNASDYTWSKFKGDQGVQGPQGPTGGTGPQGPTGDKGQSLVSSTPEYYLSTSNSTQTGGSWSTTMPTMTAGRYMWSRFKLVWENPSATTYTTPVLDKICEVIKGVDEHLSQVEQTANKISWLVKSESTESNLVLTDDSLTAIANNIDLTGKVSFNSLDSSTQSTLNKVNNWSYNGTTTIDGGKIETNTITANQIKVGDFTNYFTKEYNSEFTGSGGVNVNGYVIRNDGQGTNNYQHISLTGKLYSLNGGEKFRITGKVKTGSGTPSTGLTFKVQGSWRDVNGDIVSGSSTVLTHTTGTADFKWTTFNDVLTVASMPSNASYYSVKAYIADDTIGRVHLQAFTMNKMMSGELVVDGAINGHTITGSKIYGATIKNSETNPTFQVLSNGNTKIGGNTGFTVNNYERAQFEITSNGTLYSVSKSDGKVWTILEEGTLKLRSPDNINGNPDSTITTTLADGGIQIGDLQLGNRFIGTYSNTGQIVFDRPFYGNSWVYSATYMEADQGFKTANDELTFGIRGANLASTDAYSARIKYRYNGSNYYFHPHSNGNVRLGTEDQAWNIVYATNGCKTTSDRTMKENIKYLNYDEINALADTGDDISTSDMYNFIKDDYLMATYNYINDEDKKPKVSAIAQDILYNADGSDNRIGNLIVECEETTKEHGYLSMNQTQLLNITIGALQQAMKEIEILKARIEELEK